METKARGGPYFGKPLRPEPKWRTVAEIERDRRRRRLDLLREWEEKRRATLGTKKR